MRLVGQLAAAAAVVACGGSFPATEPHPLIDQSPPSVERVSLAGSFLTIPAAGHVTMVDFWATYCAPCLALMPSYEALWREHNLDGLVVIGVAADDNPGLVAQRLKSMHITYPNLLDDQRRSVQGAYHVTDLPRTLLFDRRGRLRLVLTGGSGEDAEKVRAGAEALLAE